jgi:hypothetical protein
MSVLTENSAASASESGRTAMIDEEWQRIWAETMDEELEDGCSPIISVAGASTQPLRV